MDVNKTYCGDHFAAYTSIKSLCKKGKKNTRVIWNVDHLDVII